MDHFLPFYHPNSPKNQNFLKMKKTPGNIISLHKCTKNHDHTLSCSWDMACGRCNCYFSFWAILCLFTPSPSQQLKKSKLKKKKRKKHLEISSFYICVPKIMIRWSMVPEIQCMTDKRTDRWTDGRKNLHREVGAPPKKSTQFALKWAVL